MTTARLVLSAAMAMLAIVAILLLAIALCTGTLFAGGVYGCALMVRRALRRVTEAAR